MKKVILILICCVVCGGTIAQSLGRMTLGCTRADIPSSLPNGFNICKTNTSNQLTYSTSSDGSEYVSFYLRDNIVYKIVMHKFLGMATSNNEVNSKLEAIFMDLCETWGEPSYVGDNIYWNFSTSKATFSYTVSKSQFQGLYGLETYYTCYADIKLEKRSSLFE